MSHTVESDPPAAPNAPSAQLRVRLRNFLPVVFCLLISVVALLIIFITNRSATHSIEVLAEEVMTRVSQRVVEKTSYYLDSAAQVVQMNATQWQRGQPDPEYRFGQRLAMSGLLGTQPHGKGSRSAKPTDPPEAGADAAPPPLSAGEGLAFLEMFNRTTRGQLNLFPYFGLVYYGDQQGNHWLNKREQDGTIHVRVITRKDDSADSKQAMERLAKLPKATEEERTVVAQGLAPYLETVWYEQDKQGQLVRGESDPLKIYDPRTRPWYKGAQGQQKLFWTDVYAWEEKYQGVVSRQVGITVSAPVLRGGQLAGVSGIDISLQAVSLFLRDMEIMKNGRAFILNGKGETVGLPNYGEVLAQSDASSDAVRLNHVSKISDPVVAASYAAMRAGLGLGEQQLFALQKEQVITFPVSGQNYYGFYKPFATELGLNWAVGVVIPEDDFLGSVKQEMRRSLLIALASICFMLVAGLFIGRMITRPLTHLGKEVERIMQLDLAPSPSLSTRFLEFSMISLAFTRMKLTLAGMVNTLSVHTKTLDWTAEEFSNIALTLDDSAQTMQGGVQALQAAVQQLPDETPAKGEMVQAMGQVEESLGVLSQLGQTVVERVDEMNQGAHALRETLQSVRI
ncbi:MAG: methyl-accepting chemotaxis protein [Magnetococcus sp. MYC-9]